MSNETQKTSADAVSLGNPINGASLIFRKPTIWKNSFFCATLKRDSLLKKVKMLWMACSSGVGSVCVSGVRDSSSNSGGQVTHAQPAQALNVWKAFLLIFPERFFSGVYDNCHCKFFHLFIEGDMLWLGGLKPRF